MDPSTACKIFFGLGTIVDIGGTLIPSFRDNIMNYGSRNIKTPLSITKADSRIPSLFRYIAALQVPHTWFTHYYIVSVACSLFWAQQLYTRGSAFKFLASYPDSGKGEMTVNQVFLAWLCMAFQGCRRLYESITLTKPSASRMWVGLWLIGIAYYIFMGVSVWIEGIGPISRNETELNISSPSIKTTIAIPLFVLASSAQHICHIHLASLKKYTLPQHRLFQSIVCPHYTSECLIYVAIAILAAPEGYFLNRTVLAGLCFVVSNLAVTADSTRKWYWGKFGVEKMVGKWRMVPYVY